MGCDCGCGGAPGCCGPRLEREMFDRSWEIGKTAKQLEIEQLTKKIKTPEKKQ